jgi:hypothetical protein
MKMFYMNDVCYFQFEHLKRDFSYHCAIRAVIKAEIYNIDTLANNMEKVKRPNNSNGLRDVEMISGWPLIQFQHSK